MLGYTSVLGSCLLNWKHEVMQIFAYVILICSEPSEWSLRVIFLKGWQLNWEGHHNYTSVGCLKIWSVSWTLRREVSTWLICGAKTKKLAKHVNRIRGTFWNRSFNPSFFVLKSVQTHCRLHHSYRKKASTSVSVDGDHVMLHIGHLRGDVKVISSCLAEVPNH